MKGHVIIKVLAAFWSVAAMGLIQQSCAKTEGGDNKRMLEALDRTIAERDIYERIKRERIDSIKAGIRSDTTDSSMNITNMTSIRPYSTPERNSPWLKGQERSGPATKG